MTNTTHPTKRAWIRTFGCQMNERDSEIMAQALARRGYAPTDAPEDADLALVNTCSVRDKAEQKVYSLLGQLRDARNRGGKPGLIGVCGCVAQQEGEAIMTRMPAVDLVMGTQAFHRLPDLLARLEKGERRILALDLSPRFVIPTFRPAPPREQAARGPSRFVTIMQGCDNFCSYCVVPYTRGREISRPADDILAEARHLVDDQGVREITLLGQNVNSYGKKGGGATDFPALLRQAAAIPGLSRLRFTTSHPKDLSVDLMRCFAELPTLCPHMHLAAQSGSDQVLARMNRGYTAAEYLDKVRRLREFRPDIALSTDLIVGFPGETDEDFEATLRLMEAARFAASFSFKYSDRPQARAASFPDKVAEDVKAARLARLQEVQNALTLAGNQALLHRDVAILVEGPSASGVQGRTPDNRVVHATAAEAGEAPRPAPPPPGALVAVRITQAGPHSLKGTLP